MAALPKYKEVQRPMRAISVSGPLRSTDVVQKNKDNRSSDASLTRRHTSSKVTAADDSERGSQYLDDYRKYVENKDREPQHSDFKSDPDVNSRFSRKPRLDGGSKDRLDRREEILRSKPVIRGFTGRSESLVSLRDRHTTRHSLGGEIVKSDKNLGATSSSCDLLRSRSSHRLHGIGLTSVELKTGKNKGGKVEDRKLGDACVQTELAGDDMKDNCAQTDYVTDDDTFTESDVTGDAFEGNESDDLENDYESSLKEIGGIFRKYDANRSKQTKTNEFRSRLDRSPSPDRNSIRNHRYRTGVNDSPSGFSRGTAVSEYDSGLENTFASSFWKRNEIGSKTVGSDRARIIQGSRMQSFASLPDVSGAEVKDFCMQATQTRLTQTPTKLRVQLNPGQMEVLGAMPLGDWLLLDSGNDEGLLLDSWPVAGRKGESGRRRCTPRRDFATQTFGQAMNVVQTTNETQTDDKFLLRMDSGTEDCDEDNQGSVVGDLRKTVSQTMDINEDQVSWSQQRTSKKDSLTDEIIQMFKDTRRLIADATVGRKKTESDKSKLMKIMLKEVKNLKNRVCEERGTAKGSRKSTKRERKSRARGISGDAESHSDYGSEEDENERRYARRRMEIYNQYQPSRIPKTSTGRTPKDREYRDEIRQTSDDRWRFRDRRYSGTEVQAGSTKGGVQLDVGAPSRLDNSGHALLNQGLLAGNWTAPGPLQVSWNRQVQVPAAVSSVLHKDTANNLDNNSYNRGLPLNTTAPSAQMTSHGLPLQGHGLGHGQGQGSSNQAFSWSGAGQFGQNGVVNQTQPNASSQTSRVVFVPIAQTGSTPHPTVFPGHPSPSVFIPTGTATYVPTQMPSQSNLSAPAQAGVVVTTSIQPVGLNQPIPTATTLKPTGSVRLYDLNSPEPTISRRSSTSKRWRDDDLERSVEQASMEAERIRALSTRLLRRSEKMIMV